MRYLITIICLSLFTLSITAQDTVRRPEDLPDPIFQDDLLYRVDAQQVVWLDNETVVFEPFTHLDVGVDENGETASLQTSHIYNVATGELTTPVTSLFSADMPSDLREWYRVTEDVNIFQSPYTIGDNNPNHRVMYRSNVDVFNGVTYPITMYGTYAPDITIPFPEDMAGNGRFEPTQLFITGGFRVLWSPDNRYALIEAGNNFGVNPALIWLNLFTGRDTPIDVSYADALYDRVLAISDDGQRMIFASSMSETAENPDNTQKLVIWDAPYYDESCECTYDQQLTFINPDAFGDASNSRFVGASFVNEDTILYIGEIGLMRYNLRTGISNLIDPNYNSGWIVNAHFSPDNSHALIVTDQEIYVVSLF